MKNVSLKMLCLAALVAAPASAANTPVNGDDHGLGDPKAPVVVVEYGSPMCPYCARFATTVLPELKQAYIDTGKVYFVFRILPLGAPDGAVAGMARCIGKNRNQEKYFAFLDLAYRKQAMWDPDGYDIRDVRGALVKLGGLAGLKPAEAGRCMRDQEEMTRINNLSEVAEKTYGITGVPTLVIEGKVVPHDEMSWPALQRRIDALLAKPH